MTIEEQARAEELKEFAQQYNQWQAYVNHYKVNWRNLNPFQWWEWALGKLAERGSYHADTVGHVLGDAIHQLLGF